MRITKQTIPMFSSSGEITGYVHPALPGLAIIRFPDRKDWVLTHVKSGLSCGNVQNKRTAILVLEHLIADHIDWTLDQDTLVGVHSRRWLEHVIHEAIWAARCGRLKQKFLFAA